MTDKLSGKVAIVTGGGRGIGAATALALASEGAKVAVVARSADEIDAIANECNQAGGEAIAIVADVAKKDQVAAMAANVYETFGRVDILVNNAGVGLNNSIPDITEEEWDMSFQANAKGVFLCTQAVFANMCAQGSGYIINVTSRAGKRGIPTMGAYCSSKWAANGFTEVTAIEGRPYGVRASLVCPGPTDTQMRRKNHDNEILENLSRPEDIAEGILFLLGQSPQAFTSELVIATPLNFEAT